MPIKAAKTEAYHTCRASREPLDGMAGLYLSSLSSRASAQAAPGGTLNRVRDEKLGLKNGESVLDITAQPRRRRIPRLCSGGSGFLGCET